MMTEPISHEVHGRMAAEVSKPIEAFLKSLHSTFSANSNSITPTLLVGFLTSADRLSHQCSLNLAWYILENSKLPDMRGVSEGTLVRLVRSRCFERLDEILECYVAYLAQLNIDLRDSIKTLSDSQLRDRLSGVEMSSSEPVKRFKLPTASKEAALLKLLEYLNNLDPLLDVLFEYGSRKIGGVDGDTTEISTALRATHQELLGKCISLIEELDMIKRRLWEQESASESAIINAVANIASSKEAKRKTGLGALFFGILFVLPVWFIATSGTSELYAGMLAAISALIGGGFLLRAVITIAAR
jgi:hypothetical protein